MEDCFGWDGKILSIDLPVVGEGLLLSIAMVKLLEINKRRAWT
jgi:hypothetical protein